MPTELVVRNYLAASLLLEREPQQWHALVVLDSDKRATGFVAAHARSHLVLHFDDIEHPRPQRTEPTERDVAAALAFARGKERLLVSCRAGRGRSVALAYLIACAAHGADEAVKLLDPMRHRPNRLVIDIGAGLLDVPNVLERFDEWRTRFAHVRLEDYDAQAEAEFDALEAEGATNRICNT